MEFRFTLNGSPVAAQADAGEPLSSVLRRLGTGSAAESCGGGCVVLLGGRPVPADALPVGAVDGDEITTLEGFEGTAECDDVRGGFAKAGIRPCRLCEPARILAAHELLERSFFRPTRQECAEFAEEFACPCTERGAFAQAVQHAAAARLSRTGKRRG